MSRVVRDEGRSPSLHKRRFYARYMRWIERIGYGVVVVVIGAFVYAFTARVDDVISADGVELAPAVASLTATGPTLVVRRIAGEGAEVASGAPLFEVVEGPEATRTYRLWAAAEEIGDPALRGRYPRPATRIVVAPRGGTFRFDTKGDEAADGEVIARVTDFNEVHAQASLAGDTAARAKAGGAVRLTDLAFPNPDGVTLRAPGIVSRGLLGPTLRKEIEGALVGTRVRIKGETLSVKSVTDVGVNARLGTESAPGTGGIPLDLEGNAVLRGRVVSGEVVATAQLVALPADLAARVRDRVTALAGTTVVAPDGSQKRIVNAAMGGVLVKIKAEGLASGPAANATPLKTTFDADVRLDAPGATLIRALREADRSGKPVTARVELVTGNRPLAFVLLKRS